MKGIIVVYLVMSFVTFCVYGLDKRAARRHSWRMPEATLHLLDLAGGWPGGLVAQQVFHHKTRKRSFRIMFWFTVAANLVFLGVLWATL